jgi:peroxiredoxin
VQTRKSFLAAWLCILSFHAMIPSLVKADSESRAFVLESVTGKAIEVRVSNQPRWTVVVFLGTECPLARLYGPRLQKLADEFASQQVHFVGVISNQQDSAKEILDFATEYSIRFPLLKDQAQRIADQYGAMRTPEVYVLDRELRVRYHGRIDDQYLPGVARPDPEREDLRVALGELVAGKPVSLPETEPQGCLIGRVKQPIADAEVTFCNQVVRMLNQSCVECHRAGEIAPFALTDYEEVVGWGEMICEVIEQGRMPPWHADPAHGSFRNERLFREEQKQLLRAWVDAGAPYGNPSDLPDPPTFVDGWQLPREPDLVVEMRDRPFQVPADGTVEYQYFVVDPGLTEDRWVTAAQVIPGNRAVVHHSIVFVRPPDGARFRGIGWLAGYVPGQRPFELPPGRARFIPAGSKLVFQQHYTPNGKEQNDITRIGLLFGDDAEITHEAFTVVGIDQEFEIPPGDPAFQVTGNVPWFPRNGELLAVMPHMHLRGKSFECSITCLEDNLSTSGSEESSTGSVRSRNRDRTVLRVPRYDFNWQHVYELVEPMSLSDVRDIQFSVTFDNSAQNPFNPDPSETVTWGDQTWEEMAVAFFEVAQPRHPSASVVSGGEPTEISDEERSKLERVKKFADDFFGRFDANRDGFVDRHETPLSFRTFGFRQFDSDGNQRLTRDEIELSARNRL